MYIYWALMEMLDDWYIMPYGSDTQYYLRLLIEEERARIAVRIFNNAFSIPDANN